MDLSLIKHYFSPVTDQRQTAKSLTLFLISHLCLYVL